MKPPRALAFIQDLGFLIDQICFPILIAYFILEKSFFVVQLHSGAFESLGRVFARAGSVADGVTVSRFLSENLIIIYNALSLWALLTRKKPLRRSETVAEIAVPLLTIAAYISINLLGWIPAAFNPAMAPEKYALSLSLAGSAFVFGGLAISTMAIFNLRHSFSVLVQVRDIVSKGLYRHVRHPIYLGYFMQMIGFLMVIPNLWTLIWAATSGALFIWRARLEENKIAAYFPEYRDYMARTPFLIPWARGKKR